MFVLLADSYLHRLDPFAIRLTDSFGLRWYGLSYAAGFVLAWLIIRWFAVTGRSQLKPKSALDVLTYVIVGVLVGGRLGYCIFYEQHLLWDVSGSFPFWGLLAINRGGMASHGGMIGVILACMLFARRNNISSLHLLDIGAFACAPGLFLGRLANFINAELWGRALPADMQADPPWWSVKYPQEIIERWIPDGDPRLHAIEPLRDVVGSGDGFYERLVAAMQAGNAEVIGMVKPLLTAYYPSQILQAITDGPLLMGLLALIWLRPRKPGVIGGWFLIIYGVLRILTEVFRQPDEGVELTLGLLSRGQTLSVLMILVGVIGLPIVARRDVPKLGGLARQPATVE